MCRFESGSEHQFFKIQWSVRLSVRTLGFHPGKRGSTPLRSSILKHTAEVGSVRQGDPIAYVVSVF